MAAPAAVHPSEQTLQSYGLGKLDDLLSEAVGKHLAECDSCRVRVAEMTSDTFLGRLQEAQARPASIPPVGSSLPGMSKLDGDSRTSAPPPAGTMPPGLAEHPDYQVLRELGRGGMGVVYLAENRMMGRKEVLKVVGSHLLNRKGVLERFQREIRSAAQLHHPNIVTAYSATKVGESIVFSMQYVEGYDLSKLVEKNGPLQVAHACNFVYQAAQGLQYAHEHGMVHRDIKPSNLMLAREGNRPVIKILDFGLAKLTSEGALDGGLTHEGQMLGTPHYVAPEQTVNAQKADIRADIYSLGCTLYCLLAGYPPFDAASLYELLQAHHSMDAKPLNFVRPEVPMELAAVVAKMLAKEPGRRYQTPGEVAKALTPFFKKGGVVPRGVKVEVSQVGDGGAKQEAPAMTPVRPRPEMEKSTPRARSSGAAPSPVSNWEGVIELERPQPAVKAAEAVAPSRRPPSLSWLVVGGASLFGLLAMGIIVVYITTDKGKTKVTIEDGKPAKVEAGHVGIEYTPAIADPSSLKGEKPVNAAPEQSVSTNPLGLPPQGFDQSVLVSAKQEFGYVLRSVMKGDKLVMQYQYGKWKAWGTVPSESPDSQVTEGGDRCRLAVCAPLINGKTTVLVVVPAGTKDQPFEWMADQDYEKIILRINDDDGDFASNPDGGVQYRLRLSPASGRSRDVALGGIDGAESGVTPASQNTAGTSSRSDGYGFIQLFNGRNLNGWTAYGDEGELGAPEANRIWTVRDGVLHGSGGRSLLFTPRGDYLNFRVRVEAKVNHGGNSGLYFRTARGRGFSRGYEAQINSTGRDPNKTGSLYRPPQPPIGVTSSPVPPDTWFTLEVEAIGERIRVWVDGDKSVDWTDSQNSHIQGHFAIQVHDPQSHIQIRKIELLELSRTGKPLIK